MDKNTENTIRLFDNFASLYQDKYMDLDLYHDTFDLFCHYLKQAAATVLELACGPGNITRYLLQKRPDLKILGTDLSEKMLALARTNIPNAEFQRLDLRESVNLPKQFDGVVCGFGLPYLSKEETISLIKDMPRILSSGGIFYISTMEDDYRKSGFKSPSSGGDQQMYIHYHEAGYLCDALKKSGFEVLDLMRKDFTQSDGSTSTDLVIIAQLI